MDDKCTDDANIGDREKEMKLKNSSVVEDLYSLTQLTLEAYEGMHTYALCILRYMQPER